MSENTNNTTTTAEENSSDNESRSFDEAYVKQLRNESAGYRTKMRELEGQVSELEKLKADFEAVKGENSELKAQNERRGWAEEITKGSPVPASVLRGATKEELQAHFDEISSIVPATPDRPKTVITADTEQPLPLNGSGLESALRGALGM